MKVTVSFSIREVQKFLKSCTPTSRLPASIIDLISRPLSGK
ncbi:unnamed protein product [Schistosoma curassoni]|uniref:DNA_pol3_beta domain-containing protein n=1 Tax=Schistosoma curassoni TaxID=6186 RepID=A0A183KXU6_9TREM|nr:unnamed protein product [Schistosoma curassoni]